eukprot:1393872-Amorphochlora_amoeboformis.AAC.2
MVRVKEIGPTSTWAGEIHPRNPKCKSEGEGLRSELGLGMSYPMFLGDCSAKHEGNQEWNLR